MAMHKSAPIAHMRTLRGQDLDLITANALAAASKVLKRPQSAIVSAHQFQPGCPEAIGHGSWKCLPFTFINQPFHLMLEQQDFQFAGIAPKPLRNRLWEYACLLAIFLKFYLQARFLMAQNKILSWRLQLCELPLLYLKMQVFLFRLSLGLPIAECWPAEKSLPPIQRF